MAIENPTRRADGANSGSSLPGAALLLKFRTWVDDLTRQSARERAVSLTQAAALVILVIIPFFLLLYRGRTDISLSPAEPGVAPVAWPAGRIIWTIVIALLPLFIVSVGFYAWRRICPLAIFGRMSEWVQWPDRPGTPNAAMRRKRVPKWVASGYPAITSGFLILMLVARILLINSNAAALAATFAGLCLLAALCSFLFTGKSWCNFFCPVGTIERLYTDTARPNYRRNSQCSRCTGCKTVPSGGLCPDINQENDYWQEIRNRTRVWAFYSWPGVVLGFYLWYYLHRPYYWHMSPGRPDLATVAQYPALPGTDWGYYLSGDWTRQPSPWLDWFRPGFGFHGLPAPLAAIPTIVAAPLTLLVSGVVSFALFLAAERLWLRAALRRGRDAERAREEVRHQLFAAAGFLGFVCFYQFAGAPTFRQLPMGAYGALRFGVTVTATTVLLTRLRRTRSRQLQYDQARKWLQRWPLPDVPPPNDLEEAYRLVTEHLRTSDERTRIFQNSIRGMLADNLLTATEVGLLDRMAEDIGLDDSEKKKIVRNLSSEYPGLFKGNLDDSLRLLGYRAELERSISDNRGVLPDRTVLRSMQSRYRISQEEHESILTEMRDPNGARTEHLRRELDELKQICEDAELLGVSKCASLHFLHLELLRLLQEQREHVLEIANLYGSAGELTGLASAIRHGDGSALQKAIGWVREHLPDAVAGTVADALSTTTGGTHRSASPEELTAVLARRSADGETPLRAAAIYSLQGTVPSADFTGSEAHGHAVAALESEDSLLREAAVAALAPELSPAQWRAALSDSARNVRRAAIQRVCRPLEGELREILAQRLDDMDPFIGARAAALLEGPPPGAEGAAAIPLTQLERMFALRGMSLLSTVPTESLRYLAEHTEELVLQGGDALCVQGEPGDEVFLVLEGQTEAVREANGVRSVLGFNRPGECVGEMAVLDPAPRHATVRAVTPRVRVLTVRGDHFRQMLARNNSTTIGVIRLLIQRQRDMSRQRG